MEEDTGKSLHVGGLTGRISRRRVLAARLQPGRGAAGRDRHQDGRPGRRPRRPAVARAYVAALRDLLKSLGVSDVRMDQGSLRCDANLSLTPAGSPVLGTRTETKNVNSLRSVERAVRYEITRQAALLAAGGRIKQETRHFDESTGTTASGPVEGDGGGLPVLPGAGSGAAGAGTGVGGGDPGRPARVPWLRRAGCRPPGASPIWRCGTWSRRTPSSWSPPPSTPARRRPRRGPGGPPTSASRPTPSGSPRPSCRSPRRNWPDVIGKVSSGALTTKLARQVVDGVLAGEGSPDEVIAARGLAVVSDDSSLQKAVDEALAAQPASPTRSGRARCRRSARSSAR